MCGIVGYVGDKEASEFLIDGLRRLEYRGYDSAGIAVFDGEKINITKKKGRLANLEAVLKEHPLHGHIGVGHTRWATHGQPSDVNSHPHGDCHNHFVVVHNGIIENYMELKKQLIARGHIFKSETDSEVVAHLAEELDDGDFFSTIRKVTARITGTYTLLFMNSDFPDTIICTKKSNPLIIGLGKGENFIASDIPAVINKTRRIFIINDNEIAIVKKDKVSVFDAEGLPVSKKVQEVTWTAEAAEKNGYPHFMLKEIYEQPKAVRDTTTIHVDKDGMVCFDNLNWTKADLENIDNILITACGTAYHAGLVAKHYIERFVKIPVEVDIASEYRYRQPLTSERTLCIVVSQSGETLDTLEALKEAKRLGARSIAVTNSIGSSIAREAEPLSNLDAKLRGQMRIEISKLHQRLGTTIIYVTHDQTEAMTLGTRIVVMNAGVVQQVDTPQVLYDTPCNLFVAGFIGSPQMNFLDAVCQKKGDKVVLKVGPADIELPPAKAKKLIDGGYEGKTVVLGIRPEDVHDEQMFITSSPNTVIQAKIRVYEMLGAEVYLHFDYEGATMTARVDPRTTARTGDTVTFAFDAEKIHVFDKETEKTITN